jgi:hypothetical protein
LYAVEQLVNTNKKERTGKKDFITDVLNGYEGYVSFAALNQSGYSKLQPFAVN